MVALALVACNPRATYGPGVALESPTAEGNTAPRVRSPDEQRTPPRERPRTPSTGVLVIAVTDDAGRSRSDVPVVIEGEGLRRSVYTDAGRARVRLPAGRYHVEVPAGCSRHVIVRRGASGTAGVAAGQAGLATLTVQVERRTTAVGPATWSLEPPWPDRETISFTYQLWDRCRERAARDVPFDGLSYRTSKGLEIVGTHGMRSDADGIARIDIRCVKPGGAALFLEDTEDPSDVIDLLSLRQRIDMSSSWCA